MLSQTRQWEDEIQVEESKLPLTGLEIKREADEEVTVAPTVQDKTLSLCADIVKLTETDLLTHKIEPKCEEGDDSSSGPPGPNEVIGKSDNRGKCPVCPKRFAYDRLGFQEISRHILHSHKKTSSRIMLALRMTYCSSKTYSMIKQQFQYSCNIPGFRGGSDRVLRRLKSKTTAQSLSKMAGSRSLKNTYSGETNGKGPLENRKVSTLAQAMSIGTSKAESS